MTKKLGVILIVLFLFSITVGCSNVQEENEPEVVWDTLPIEDQSIEVTVTDIAKENMETDWKEKSSNTSLFMLIPGSS